VQAQAKNARLIFIGGASRPLHQSVYDGLIRRAVEYGLGNRVICLQNVPEDLLYDYYRLSDVYVSSTSQQDWIMSIAEAMVCGLPIVSRGQEFMVYEGVNGLVVPPPDAKIMAEAILKLYNDKDKRQAMGNESKKIVQQYDWDKVAGEIVKKYESLLGSG